MLNDRTLSLIGRCFYAVALVGSGIQQILTGQFMRLVPRPPSTVPTPWPALVGVMLVVWGGMMLIRWRGWWAGLGFAALLFASFLFQHVPIILANPQHGYVWTNPCKVLALIAGALVVKVALRDSALPGHAANARRALMTAVFARVALGVFLLVCGVQHFVYADFVVTLVPAWAGNALVWTYFTGTALIAGGVGLLLPATVRWAALLSGVMVFLWVLLLHIPRAIAGPDQRGEMGGVFEALAISGVALALAAHAWMREARQGA